MYGDTQPFKTCAKTFFKYILVLERDQSGEETKKLPTGQSDDRS